MPLLCCMFMFTKDTYLRYCRLCLTKPLGYSRNFHTCVGFSSFQLTDLSKALNGKIRETYKHQNI